MKPRIHLLVLFSTLFVAFTYPVQAQTQPLDTRINLLFGLNQPLLANGFNIEGNFFYRRLAFDYSHGVSLDFTGPAVTPEMAEQQIVAHLPYTTGFGVGYRFNHWLNLRLEPKWHRFELYNEGAEQTEDNLLLGYNTFSLGLGLYMNFLPFKNHHSPLLNGIMVSPSLRYWPTLSSSLPAETVTYYNPVLEQNVEHERLAIGFANTPVIVNVSVGYSLQLNRRK